MQVYLRVFSSMRIDGSSRTERAGVHGRPVHAVEYAAVHAGGDRVRRRFESKGGGGAATPVGGHSHVPPQGGRQRLCRDAARRGREGIRCYWGRLVSLRLFFAPVLVSDCMRGWIARRGLFGDDSLDGRVHWPWSARAETSSNSMAKVKRANSVCKHRRGAPCELMVVRRLEKWWPDLNDIV